MSASYTRDGTVLRTCTWLQSLVPSKLIRLTNAWRILETERRPVSKKYFIEQQEDCQSRRLNAQVKSSLVLHQFELRNPSCSPRISEAAGDAPESPNCSRNGCVRANVPHRFLFFLLKAQRLFQNT